MEELDQTTCIVEDCGGKIIDEIIDGILDRHCEECGTGYVPAGRAVIVGT